LPARPYPGAPGAFTVALEGTWLGAGPPRADLFVAGVVPLRDAQGHDVSVEISRAVAGGGEAAAAGALPWLRAVLLGWLGGLILNGMPCVLPVLAIKLAALAELAQGSRREHCRHAAAYAGGIALSMLALAAVVVGLRAAGTAVGWGFQLQEPIFLVAISALLVAFALNLFGAFEIEVDTGRLGGLGSGAPGAMRSFSDGLLAVALATPCSAPFLGTAVGFAFASSAPVIASIFLAIGLGLATPFLLAAFFPAVARRMPRSGAWMADLRGGLGFALLLTVVWLLWILGRVAGAQAIPSALVLLLGIASAGWALGAVQRRGRRVPASAFAGVLSAIAALGIASLDLAPHATSGASEPVIRGTRLFAAHLVDESLDAGRPVFVYFTADWCVTCKVNEAGVLADRRVEPELERLGYDVYRADWTRRDETIRGELARLGKAGVPVYALYAPDAPGRPRLLPELLTVDSLLGALREVAARDHAGR
jgi:thiol:disulfide interchange protein DsbD